MNNRIAPILAILAWLYGGRVAGADELAHTHQTTGLGDMNYRVDKAFDWRQPWHASEASQLGASWGATDKYWEQGDDHRGAYSLAQSPAYAYSFSSLRYVSYVEVGAGVELAP
ncbi:hypothetical protein SAMN05216603_11058 [Pseudomonas benzenivorans]|nr:acyloxyacyl hydrolase [Pseudomonas benzenivorans]SDH54501.1 hypothetical protein SAMN05216603_11058 [Pseudomonas benzenivorans]